MSNANEHRHGEVPEETGTVNGHDRRRFLRASACAIGAAATPTTLLGALDGNGGARAQPDAGHSEAHCGDRDVLVRTKDKVPDPVDIEFRVRYDDRDPIRLVGHYWYSKEAVAAGRKCPAIVELNPYRRRDGTIAVDSQIYPWFAYHEYLCFRVDLQGSGDSDGVLTDEYTDEELSYCVQVVEQIAAHPLCDGSVGMMGESWSAINSLMVAARSDCPVALKAVIVNCGSDDRYGDDVHYMGGAMMQDNAGWPSSMWGWLAQPPDPAVVGDRWQAMWRQRIENADFWFKQWATHQARDACWARGSVRGDYGKVKVPVLIMSGWQDGYKNPVDTVLRGLASAGVPVAALVGPWGHKYPFSGHPGPRINWLPYAVTHWWDKWLKGREPAAETTLPQLTVWLGKSREPRRSTGYCDSGRWVAEDAHWPARVAETTFHLSPRHRLSPLRARGHDEISGSSRLVFATAMLETSSFGTDGNDDLPGDLSQADRQSLHFDSEKLGEDLDCFGYPTAILTLACDKPLASIAVRLSEVSPRTRASHLVSYAFFNLCHRDGDPAAPQRITPGVPFSVRIPLNLTGHTFRKGWRIRLAVSPSFFPTMWQSAERATITLHTGAFGAFPGSALVLPGRKPREADARMKDLLPPDARALSVDVEDYAPTTEGRPGKNSRDVERVTVGGRRGVLVRKVTDTGRSLYKGHLQGLWVEQVTTENFRMLDDDPLSYTCFTSSKTTLERPQANWQVRATTSTKVRSERDQAGRTWFHYTATVETFIGNGHGGYKPFVQRTVNGTIPRDWV